LFPQQRGLKTDASLGPHSRIFLLPLAFDTDDDGNACLSDYLLF
jgi:hypothetical protein